MVKLDCLFVMSLLDDLDPLEPLEAPLEIDLILIGLLPLSILFYGSVPAFLRPKVVILISPGLLSVIFYPVFTISSESIALGISSIILGGEPDLLRSESFA